VTVRIRPLAGVGELEAFERVRALAFGDQFEAARLGGLAAVAELDRMWVATDHVATDHVATGDVATGDEIVVGTAAAYSFAISMPGGTDLKAAGLKALATRPTHRRRGVLRALMARTLGDAHDRGEPLAVLWASEAGIYHRFGFGLSASVLGWDVPSAAPFLPRPDQLAREVIADGRVRVLDNAEPLDEVLSLVAPTYERARTQRPGMLARSPAWWQRRAAQGRLATCSWALVDPGSSPPDSPGPTGPDTTRPGVASPGTISGRAPRPPEAYAAYRVEPRWGETGPDNHVWVLEAVATSREAEAALWRFLLDLDLATRVSAALRPADEALAFMLADVRSMGRRLSDGAWARILDVPAALEGRTYAVPGRITFDLDDELCPWNAGRWALDVGPDGASCRPASGRESADLHLGTAELSAAVLGGSRLVGQAAAGLVDEHRPGALGEADRMFSWPVAPWTVTYF